MTPTSILLLCFVKNQKDLTAKTNTLRPRQNGRRFAEDTFKRIFLNKNVRISIKISLKFVPKCPINNNPALVHIMAWRWSGDKPLSEPMMFSLLTHICVTRPQRVKTGVGGMVWRLCVCVCVCGEGGGGGLLKNGCVIPHCMTTNRDDDLRDLRSYHPNSISKLIETD